MRDYDHDDPFVVIEREEGSVRSFILGLAVGAGVALLFAPRSGVETRRAIGSGARRVRQRAQQQAEAVSDQMLDRYEQARRTVEDKLETARRAIELKKRQAQRAVQAGREAAMEARQDLERRIAESKAAYQADADVARGARAGAPATDTVEET